MSKKLIGSSTREAASAKKPKRNWLKIILFSLLALLILSGVFYVGMFYEAYWIATQKPLVETPMEVSLHADCDLDWDGDCDKTDEQIFNDAFGKCRGEPGYNFNADIDGDGCVVTNDQQSLFPK